MANVLRFVLRHLGFFDVQSSPQRCELLNTLQKVILDKFAFITLLSKLLANTVFFKQKTKTCCFLKNRFGEYLWSESRRIE